MVGLSDVSPHGVSRPVAEGILGARFRDSQTAPSLLERGNVYEFTVDLCSTSSCFPWWDRNLNIGGAFGLEPVGRPTINTVFRDRFRPSHIVLPVWGNGGGAVRG